MKPIELFSDACIQTGRSIHRTNKEYGIYVNIGITAGSLLIGKLVLSYYPDVAETVGAVFSRIYANNWSFAAMFALIALALTLPKRTAMLTERHNLQLQINARRNSDVNSTLKGIRNNLSVAQRSNLKPEVLIDQHQNFEARIHALARIAAEDYSTHHGFSVYFSVKVMVESNQQQQIMLFTHASSIEVTRHYQIRDQYEASKSTPLVELLRPGAKSDFFEAHNIGKEFLSPNPGYRSLYSRVSAYKHSYTFRDPDDMREAERTMCLWVDAKQGRFNDVTKALHLKYAGIFEELWEMQQHFDALLNAASTTQLLTDTTVSPLEDRKIETAR